MHHLPIKHRTTISTVVGDWSDYCDILYLQLIQPPDTTDIDWWCKYYASIGENDKCQKYIEQGFDSLMVGS